MPNTSSNITQEETIVEMETIQLGIIGMGDMGKLYARTLSAAGWKNVNVCDMPNKYEALCEEFAGTGIRVMKDGHLVSRQSDWILYSVPAEFIDSVVATYGPSTKIGAIVAGQTSVKAPEIAAFEKHLPEDVYIITCHSMHGPTVSSKGQPLVIINHRGAAETLALVERILSCFESEIAHLSYKEHDRITADTQAVTHMAFLSMGTTWKHQDNFPWFDPTYTGGIENVKVNMTMRILSNKWHVYAGLAILNPSAKAQVKQYSLSVAALFKLMIQEKEAEFVARIRAAGEFVFGNRGDREQILLSDNLLDQYSLGSVPKDKRKPNSHLSLLAMVDCWYQLKMNPYSHMVCQTPLFRFWLGISEYLFLNEDFLQDAMQAALYEKEIREDDMEFMMSARGWQECIALGNMEGYRVRFEDTAQFFKSRFGEAAVIGKQMIEMITRKTNPSTTDPEEPTTTAAP
ncbi:Prephenate dehydrogenase [Linnemannia elongata AG-77]|uniref:Prephenate dehydrogenase [NADP(+)] n=1 Tax=Linnemannia elongata AG-77 TaxID=1314771 RepID=A0A197JGV4_9FUNG|nr:Prephenate dehydrogenase [Linnemannia elongata AG-77]